MASDYWALSPEQRERRKEQMREYARSHRAEQYRRDKARRDRQPRISRKLRDNKKENIKQYINNLKCAIGECTDCGLPCEQWNVCMFAFDHLQPQFKSFALSKATAIPAITKEQIDAEIAKCELVCHNCHAFRTWIDRTHDRDKRCDNDEREYLPLLELMQ
jgi:hypothetical protein